MRPKPPESVGRRGWPLFSVYSRCPRLFFPSARAEDAPLLVRTPGQSTVILSAATQTTQLTDEKKKTNGDGLKLADEILIGGIFDLTGPTSVLGKDYAQGIADAIIYINRHGGVKGSPLRLLIGDYASQIHKALTLYQRYKHNNNIFAIQGWGTCDTMTLTDLVNKDRIIYMSASYEPKLADPQKAPYHFFVGPTYSDHARMAMQYIKKAGGRKVSFIYPLHPYGEAPIPAARDYARKLELQIGPDIYLDLRATEASSQVAKIKDFESEFAWIGGTTPSTALILKEAVKQEITTKFLINSWGMNEDLPQPAGEAAEGRALVLFGVRPFGYNVPETVKIKTVAGDHSHSIQYNMAWASMMVMWEGLKRAAEVDELNGPGLKAALETLKDFQTGGLTPPLTFAADDHRPTTTSGLYTWKDGRLTRMPS